MPIIIKTGIEIFLRFEDELRIECFMRFRLYFFIIILCKNDRFHTNSNFKVVTKADLQFSMFFQVT